MALLTYLFAFAHFSSEILIFRTAKISLPVLSPVIVASAYHFFVIDLRDLIIVRLMISPPSFFFYSYLTCMDDLTIRLLRKSMTTNSSTYSQSPNNSIQSHPSLRL
jgi:hypothetical protein